MALVKAVAVALTQVSNESTGRIAAESDVYPLKIEFPIFALLAELTDTRIESHTNFRALTGAFKQVIKKAGMAGIIESKQGATKTGPGVGYLHQAAVLDLMKRAAVNVVSTSILAQRPALNVKHSASKSLCTSGLLHDPCQTINAGLLCLHYRALKLM
jgi:hypothetical protein